MRLISSDYKRTVDIGGSDIWLSIYSTAEKRLGTIKKRIPLAMSFLKTGKCESSEAIETARQINLLRDAFAKIPPEKVVYDGEGISQRAPWEGNLSPVVTSCANFFTTADGKDLLFEIVSILSYSYYCEVAVTAE